MKRRRPAYSQAFNVLSDESVREGQVLGGLLTVLTSVKLVVHFLALVQSWQTRAFDRADMHERVFRAVL